MNKKELSKKCDATLWHEVDKIANGCRCTYHNLSARNAQELRLALMSASYYKELDESEKFIEFFTPLAVKSMARIIRLPKKCRKLAYRIASRELADDCRQTLRPPTERRIIKVGIKTMMIRTIRMMMMIRTIRMMMMIGIRIMMID